MVVRHSLTCMILYCTVLYFVLIPKPPVLVMELL